MMAKNIPKMPLPKLDDLFTTEEERTNDKLEKVIDIKLSDIDENVLTLISEIEYSPWTSNNVLIDEERFLLRMNDTNIVYTNLLHIDKLNKYIEIYATLEDKKGIIYLDSSSDKISFSSY